MAAHYVSMSMALEVAQPTMASVDEVAGRQVRRQIWRQSKLVTFKSSRLTGSLVANVEDLPLVFGTFK